jgi:hypothetical protein
MGMLLRARSARRSRTRRNCAGFRDDAHHEAKSLTGVGHAQSE